MTGPYQPPGGDFNSPFGPPDPNSPFNPASGPPNSGPGNDGPKDEESSSSAGVQYELETPGQPPVTPPPALSAPHGYRPPPPPPPAYAPRPTYAPQQPKSSSSSGNGLLIGGVIAGVVVLLLLVGIVIVVVASSGGDEEGGETAKYTSISSPCSDVDLSPVTAIASFSVEPSPSTSDYGTSSTSSCTSGILGDSTTSSYGYFNMTINTYETTDGATSMYETDAGSSGLSGCSTSEASGSWEKGTLGTGASSSCAYGYANGTMTALVIQDGNLEAKLTLDATGDLAGGAEDALKSVAESLLTAAEA